MADENKDFEDNNLDDVLEDGDMNDTDDQTSEETGDLGNEQNGGSDLDEKLEELEEGIVPGLKDIEMAGAVKDAFLEYAMSVIVARALPDVRDGLKPVHRRIIYGMNELGMQPDKPFKKCARIVGDVMGKYHPHGDTAIYFTLVRLAQPFSMRYLLVDGSGNFGSIDGDEAAAMRYTEARMSKISLEMVRDIDKETVDFTDTYDGDGQEPTVLPSRIPNLILNGSSGIAVGMATNIPPHNIVETINAVQALIVNPDLTPFEIMQQYLSGPDFPTGSIILGRSEIKRAYETGMGSIKMRARCEIKQTETGKNQIIVTELPYGVNKANLVIRIADLVKNKIIEGITEVRDVSNKEGICIIIDMRRDVNAEVILNHLYKETKLQDSFAVNMLALDRGVPKILDIKQMLSLYLAHQSEVVERRTRYDLRKAKERLEILEGLLIAIDNIDEVIAIIRGSNSDDEASNKLIDRFNLTMVQAKAILDMRLKRLTGLERGKIEAEKAILLENCQEYEHILSDNVYLLEVVNRELEAVKVKYGDERRTEIMDDVGNIEDEDLIREEDIIITLTKNGYVKRMAVDTFKSQNRGGKGIKGMTTNDEDIVDLMVASKTHTDVLFFSNFGKVYLLRGHEIPNATRTGKGLPIVNILPLAKIEKIQSIISMDSYETGYLFFATVGGVVKRTAAKEFASINKSGKIAITLRPNDELFGVAHTNGDALVSLAASNGKLVTFDEADARSMGRTAAGVCGMNLGDEETKLVGLTTDAQGSNILSVTDKGFGKITPLDFYRKTKRGSKGVITIKGTERTGNLVCTRAVNGDEDILVITSKGILMRTCLAQFKNTAGRNTQGVTIIRLNEGEFVSSISIAPHETEEDLMVDDLMEVTPETPEVIITEDLHHEDELEADVEKSEEDDNE